jgi:hypothetical protein
LATVKRAYVAAHFALDLEGEGPMGFLRSADGGGITTDIQTYHQGRMMDLWRQVGRPKFGDITLQVGMGLAPPFYDWISSFFTRKIVRKNGTIIGADFNYTERTRRNFNDALITEIGFPALDGGSKDAALMTVKLSPEGMTYETIEDGDKLQSPPGMNLPNKMWHAANFKFTIDGFEDSLQRVTKIDAFSIKQPVLDYPSGNRRTSVRVAGKIDYPPINIYIQEVDSSGAIEQAYARLIDYDAPSDGGMNASLEYLAPDLTTLATVNMTGVDIVSIEHQKLDASAETSAMVKLQIQVEAMTVEYAANADATT